MPYALKHGWVVGSPVCKGALVVCVGGVYMGEDGLLEGGVYLSDTLREGGGLLEAAFIRRNTVRLVMLTAAC